MMRRYLTLIVTGILMSMFFIPPASAAATPLPPGKWIKGYGVEYVTYTRHLHAFVVGTNRGVYHTYLQSNGRWHRWEYLGGRVRSHVDSKVVGMNLLVSAAGMNKIRYYDDYIRGYGWYGWSGWFVHWSSA
jgi:hypothetical protein